MRNLVHQFSVDTGDTTWDEMKCILFVMSKDDVAIMLKGPYKCFSQELKSYSYSTISRTENFAV